jgi:hypothetical protein
MKDNMRLLMIFLANIAILNSGEVQPGSEMAVWMPPTGNAVSTVDGISLVTINVKNDEPYFKKVPGKSGLIMVGNLHTYDVAYMFSPRSIHQVTIDNRLGTIIVYFKTMNIMYAVTLPIKTYSTQDIMKIISEDE